MGSVNFYGSKTESKPGDDPQHPSINLIFNQQDETTNAVKGLRKNFDSWKKKGMGISMKEVL